MPQLPRSVIRKSLSIGECSKSAALLGMFIFSDDTLSPRQRRKVSQEPGVPLYHEETAVTFSYQVLENLISSSR